VSGSNSGLRSSSWVITGFWLAIPTTFLPLYLFPDFRSIAFLIPSKALHSEVLLISSSFVFLALTVCLKLKRRILVESVCMTIDDTDEAVKPSPKLPSLGYLFSWINL